MLTDDHWDEGGQVLLLRLHEPLSQRIDLASGKHTTPRILRSCHGRHRQGGNVRALGRVLPLGDDASSGKRGGVCRKALSRQQHSVQKLVLVLQGARTLGGFLIMATSSSSSSCNNRDTQSAPPVYATDANAIASAHSGVICPNNMMTDARIVSGIFAYDTPNCECM